MGPPTDLMTQSRRLHSRPAYPTEHGGPLLIPQKQETRYYGSSPDCAYSVFHALLLCLSHLLSKYFQVRRFTRIVPQNCWHKNMRKARSLVLKQPPKKQNHFPNIKTILRSTKQRRNQRIG